MVPERFALRSLSARLFWLTVIIILLVEILAVMPDLGLARQRWLWHRVTQAQLAALSVADAGTLPPRLHDALLQLTGTQSILVQSGSAVVSLQADNMPPMAHEANLDKASLLGSIWSADMDVLGLGPRFLRIEASMPGPPPANITIVMKQAELAHSLRQYFMDAVILAAVQALVTGGLVFVTLNSMLVRPMRLITASIAGFRRNPGQAGFSELKRLSGRRDDEIARTARELAEMQDELRADLWRNARLAALGTAVAKISHDLRNILTSALLVADRFQRHGDPAVQQAANTLIPAMERAVDMVSRTLDFAQDGPPALTRAPVTLHMVAAEVADMLRATDASVHIENQLPANLVLSLDRNQIFRVLVNLLRNAAEAGATRISLSLERENGIAMLVIADDGPGLPRKVIANLFRPFTGAGRNGGTGLGLAIARDLVRAHGGDLLLRRTGPEGTEFAMTLPGDPHPLP